MATISITRFRDLVQINPPTGATFYLDVNSANRLANALKCVTMSIESEAFAESDLPTMEYPVERCQS